MDDLRFYVLFNSISVISGRLKVDNERIYAIEPRLRLKRYPPPAGLEPGTTRSAGPRLIPTELQWLIRPPTSYPLRYISIYSSLCLTGYVLKQSPFDAWASDQMVDVPVLIGMFLRGAVLLFIPFRIHNSFFGYSCPIYGSQLFIFGYNKYAFFITSIRFYISIF